jgi:hypothetical protein
MANFILIKNDPSGQVEQRNLGESDYLTEKRPTSWQKNSYTVHTSAAFAFV